jgi:hypothetical protein
MDKKVFLKVDDSIFCFSKPKFKKYLKDMIKHKNGKCDKPNLVGSKLITNKIICSNSFDLDDGVEVLKKLLDEVSQKV